MAKKILKINSWLLIIIGTILMVLSTIFMIYNISIPSEPNSWDDLGKFVIEVATIIVCILCFPIIMSGITTLINLKGKNNYKLFIIFNIFGIFLYSVFMLLFIDIDIINIFNDYPNGTVNTRLKILLTTIICFIFICPLLVNSFILFKEKKNMSFKNLIKKYRFVVICVFTIISIFVLYNIVKLIIINTNKIKITENNIYSYSDFKSQLESRHLIYKLPVGKGDLAGSKEISALDSSSIYGYQFSGGSYTLSINTDRKFPMFVYNSYTSLIKKSDKTASYYNIGPEDWYITWYIYYVNGKIYAAIGDESEYGSLWETSLSTTKYGIVVSEENKITIYNSQKNCYIKGGGIIDTSSGMVRTEFPTTSDIYNKKSMKIRVVDKVNAETLDKIARELSPQYWKEYKSNN